MPPPWPVLLLVRELDLGGCERDLTKVALGLDRSRFEPHVACFRPQGFRGEELRGAGIPVLRLPVRSFCSPSALTGLSSMGAYLARQGIRLVHCYDVPTTIFGIPAARLFRVPVAISSLLGYRDMLPRTFRQAVRITDHLLDCLVVNCMAMRRHAVEDEKVPAHRVYLCYNGVDPRTFHPLGRQRTPPLEEASLVIGVVCALRAEKRVDLLVEAFAAVRHLQAGLKLAVVGSGDELPALQTLARTLGVSGDCIFQPATREVAAWLRAMDIFVLPSISEAFSNALLEAMACGCCPVGSRVGGTPELVADGERGLLFERGNAADLTAKLTLVITRPDLRQRFAAAAAVFARENLSLERNVRCMERLYATLLESAGLGSAG